MAAPSPENFEMRPSPVSRTRTRSKTGFELSYFKSSMPQNTAGKRWSSGKGEGQGISMSCCRTNPSASGPRTATIQQLSENWLCASPADDEKGHRVSRKSSKLPRLSKDLAVLAGSLKHVDTTIGKPTRSSRASGGIPRLSLFAAPDSKATS